MDGWIKREDGSYATVWQGLCGHVSMVAWPNGDWSVEHRRNTRTARETIEGTRGSEGLYGAVEACEDAATELGAYRVYG